MKRFLSGVDIEDGPLYLRDITNLTGDIVTIDSNGQFFKRTVSQVLGDINAEPIILSGTTAQYWRGDKTWQDFGGAVRSSLLTGYTVGSDTALTATDTILQAFGKVQGQINARVSGTIASGQVAFGTGSNTIGGDSGLTWDSVNNQLLTITELGNIVRGTNNAVLFLSQNSSASNATQFRIRHEGPNSAIDSISGVLLIKTNGINRIVVDRNSLLVGIGDITPTNTLDVNGTTRIRTISNLGTAATSVLVPSATGVISSRTVLEFRSDISAITLSEARAGLTLTTFGNSGIAEYDPVTGILNIPEYNLAGLGAPTTLAQLTDVTITSPTTDQFLRYDGTEWINVSLDISPSSYQRDKFIYSSSNTFTLTRTTPNAVQVFLNGQKLQFTDDWSISGNTVTVNTPLLTGDEISIEYFYSTPDVVSSNLNGTGTANYLTKWNGTAELGVSLIQDNGSLVTLPAATDIPAVAATTDTDKFMVLDSNRIKFRTGSQILSDIGAAASSHNQNASTIQAGTFGTGNYIFPGNVEIQGQLYSPSNAKGDSGTGTVTFNWNDGNMQTVTLNGDCTFAFSNPQSGGVYQIIVTRDGTANRTINWPVGIKWGSGVAWQPAGANIIDIITISYDGTTYFAVVTTDLKTV